ncbi:MAG: hypothetical protein ACQESO_06110 [Bacillota bacterium]
MAAVKKLCFSLLVLLLIAFLISCGDPTAQQEDVNEQLPEENEPLYEEDLMFEDVEVEQQETDQDRANSEDEVPYPGSTFKHEVNIKTDGVIKEGQSDEWLLDDGNKKSSDWWKN